MGSTTISAKTGTVALTSDIPTIPTVPTISCSCTASKGYLLIKNILINYGLSTSNGAASVTFSKPYDAGYTSYFAFGVAQVTNAAALITNKSNTGCTVSAKSSWMAIGTVTV